MKKPAKPAKKPVTKKPVTKKPEDEQGSDPTLPAAAKSVEANSTIPIPVSSVRWQETTRIEEGEQSDPFEDESDPILLGETSPDGLKIRRGGTKPPSSMGGSPTTCEPSRSSSQPTTSPEKTLSTPNSSRTSSPVAAAAEPVKRPAKPVPAEPKRSVLAGVAEQIKTDAPHLEVQALAGTGKTTTIIEGLKQLKGIESKVIPSPQQQAVWDSLKLGRSASVRVSAFNNSITGEVKGRLEAAGLHLKGVEAKGIHSLGNGAVTKAFGRMEAKQAVPTRAIISRLLDKDWFDLKRDQSWSAALDATVELVSKCKCGLVDPTPENLDDLAFHHSIDLEGVEEKVNDLVPRVLEAAKMPKGGWMIEFDDMIWLPLQLGLPIWKSDVQIVDEAQDLNRMQQELVYRGGHRVIFVGDVHQAIYGFAGADAESMIRMHETLGGTPRGISTLPLTVTRRCSKAVVAEAKRYVPEFEAHESNATGSVREARYPTQGRDGSRIELPWKDTYGPLVADGSMVICRTNAPLVGQCFRFLRMGRTATIIGRNIGQGLSSLVEKAEKSGVESIPSLLSWLTDWADKETAKETAKKHPSEAKIEAINDKMECVIAFTEGAQTLTDVVRKIESTFTEERLNNGVRFSSIHKSKGLEAKDVFFLRPPGTGPRRDKMKKWELEQEDNLQYVGITRAIENLTYVS